MSNRENRKQFGEGWKDFHHPRSALEPLDEPFIDPGDGHGVYSAGGVLMLKEWKAAMKGEKKALHSMLKRIARRNKKALNNAVGQPQWSRQWNQVDWPTLVPVLCLLGIVRFERLPDDVVAFSGGAPKARVIVEDWVSEFVAEHPQCPPEAVAVIEEWVANGSIHQRPHSEESQMD